MEVDRRRSKLFGLLRWRDGQDNTDGPDEATNESRAILAMEHET